MSVVQFPTKADHAYHHVRQDIARGVLAPGATINQEELARTVGVSVTPLREALRRLAAEGFVVLAAHRDARVTPLSSADARNLREMRAPLESLAARLAAERVTPEQRDALQDLAQQLEPLDDQADERAIEVDRRFHATLWEVAHNPLLTATLDLLWDRADRYRRQSLDALRGTGARRTADFEQHFELLELVFAGDADGAAELMRRHVEHSLPGDEAGEAAARQSRASASRTAAAPEPGGARGRRGASARAVSISRSSVLLLLVGRPTAWVRRSVLSRVLAACFRSRRSRSAFSRFNFAIVVFFWSWRPCVFVPCREISSATPFTCTTGPCERARRDGLRDPATRPAGRSPRWDPSVPSRRRS